MADNNSNMDLFESGGSPNAGASNLDVKKDTFVNPIYAHEMVEKSNPIYDSTAADTSLFV